MSCFHTFFKSCNPASLLLFTEHRKTSSELKITDHEYYFDDEEITRFFRFCQSVEMDFQCLAGHKNMSVDLK